jgi:uncharacterized membrane protein YedE/YeeE
MITALWPLGAGLLFAIGLTVSGMTQPAKIRAFLDVGGHWDPSLALVMGGAVGVYIVARRWARRRRTPWLGGTFPVLAATAIDRRLVAGAAIFGVGWGLSGFCPGPALVGFGAGAPAAWWFVPGMVVGMLAYDRLTRFALQSRSQDCGSAASD